MGSIYSYYAIIDADTSEYLTCDGKRQEILTGLSIISMLNTDNKADALNNIRKIHPNTAVMLKLIDDDFADALIENMFADPELLSRLTGAIEDRAKENQ